MSRLENMIRENREAFDSYEPGTQVWDKIQKDLETKPGKLANIKGRVWRWVAAAAVFLVAVTTWYQLRDTKPPVTDPVAVTEENVPDEYADEVYHFTKLINLKHKELQQLQKEDPALYEQFADDIKMLDSSYHSLQEQVPGNPNKETLIQAMIQNLQLQIELLNKQLIITEQIKQKKSKNHESTYKTL